MNEFYFDGMVWINRSTQLPAPLSEAAQKFINEKWPADGTIIDCCLSWCEAANTGRGIINVRYGQDQQQIRF